MLQAGYQCWEDIIDEKIILSCRRFLCYGHYANKVQLVQRANSDRAKKQAKTPLLVEDQAPRENMQQCSAQYVSWTIEIMREASLARITLPKGSTDRR